mmetsp:Transcript_50409/g.146279  ORF Transcript_50409/g.146279 Transcript_50409/m.146279 type:complete len:624 (+) Transcript_50409:89-1960(+)
MGAKCCASEAAAGARRDPPLEAFAEGGVQVEAADFEEAKGKPLWLIEVESEELEAKSKPSTAEPPLPPPAEEGVSKAEEPPAPEPEAPGELPQVAAVEGKPAAKAKSGRRAGTPGGKAKARQRPKQDAEAAPAKPPAEVAPAKPPPEAPIVQAATMSGGAVYYVLRISIMGARSLRNADLPGKSDPYCTVEIPGKSSSKFKTKVLQDTLDPLWNQEVELKGVAAGDSLLFSVFDKDTLTADDLLGKAVLRKEEVVPMGFKGELPLLPAKPERRTSISSRASSQGEEAAGHLDVKVALVRSYCMNGKVKPQVTEATGSEVQEGDGSELREVTVYIYSAKDLRNADWAPGTGVSDPYCICEVPGKPSTRLRTQAANNTLNPQWDFVGTMGNYAVNDPLVFTVMDKDSFKSDDFLDRGTLDGEQLLLGYFGDLHLSGKGSIKVKVQIKDPGQAAPADTPPQDAEPMPAKPAPKAEEPPKKAPQRPSQQTEDPAKMSAALLEAADSGDAKTFKKLLAAGAPLEAVNAEGLSVLHVCVTRRNEELVARLLQHRARRRLLAARTREKETALHLAARLDLQAICGMLVKEGASARSKSAAGKTPGDLARGQLAEWLQKEDPAGTPPPWSK